MVNNFKIENAGHVNFTDMSKDLNETIKFDNNVKSDSVLLIEELTDEDMNLNSKSKLKVTVNITVDDITKDIEFYIQCNEIPIYERMLIY